MRDLLDKRADLQRELEQPAYGVGGIPSDYLVQRRATLAAHLEHIEAELAGLTGDALVWRFCKADIERAERDRESAEAGVQLEDTLLRRQRTPFRAVRVDTDARCSSADQGQA